MVEYGLTEAEAWKIITQEGQFWNDASGGLELGHPCRYSRSYFRSEVVEQKMVWSLFRGLALPRIHWDHCLFVLDSKLQSYGIPGRGVCITLLLFCFLQHYLSSSLLPKEL